MVPMAASAKARKSGPHRLRHLGRETERRRRGVASCMLRSWRVLAPWLPPVLDSLVGGLFGLDWCYHMSSCRM